jgi:hypothetical protein
VSNEHVNSTVRSILDTICPPVGATTGATMGEPVKPVEPVTMEVSNDENTATVTAQLEFIPLSWRACNFCVGDNSHYKCTNLPCGYGYKTRKDGRQGYFREVRG